MSIPVLNLAELDAGPKRAAQFRDNLRRATHEVGFFVLEGHGVPDALFDLAYRVAREFFALPEADKLAIENVLSPHFRGYTRTGGERTLGEVDWREQLDIGAERPAPRREPGDPRYRVLEGPNLWPVALPELRAVSEAWLSQLDRVARRLLSAWAEALGADAGWFDAAFAKPSPHMKIARYPGSEATSQGVGAHKDLGVLTLLSVEPGKAGLQVEHNGDWIDVAGPLNAFIVNIGELLEIATNGYLKATLHRVQTPPAGTDRISIPYFYGPSLDASLPAIPLPAELAIEARGVSADPDNPLLSVYGENWLKSRVRAHHNVVEAQYPEWLR